MSEEQGRCVVLREAWTSVLEVDDPQPEQNFFDLGGDSLDAVELLSIYESRTGAEFPLGTLFADGTLAALEEEIGRLDPTS